MLVVVVAETLTSDKKRKTLITVVFARWGGLRVPNTIDIVILAFFAKVVGIASTNTYPSLV